MAARSRISRGHRAGAVRLALVAGVLFAGCDGPQGCGSSSSSVQSIGNHAGRARPARPLPRRQLPASGSPGQPGPSAAHSLSDKVHPSLRVYLRPGAPNTPIRVIVSFRDTLTIVPFPDRARAAPVAAVKDTSILFSGGQASGPAFLAPLLAQRAADYDTLLAGLGQRHAATSARPMWLIRAVGMNVSAREVRRLAERGEVTYVEPARNGEPPPQDGDSAAVRAETGVNPLVDAGEDYETGLVALLDTGVRASHVLLQGAGDIRSLRDCVDGDADCAGSLALPGETCAEGDGHGTGTAAILTGNADLGDRYRGMTDVRIDSYRVYERKSQDGMCSADLDTEAAAHALALAASRGARVILVETQGDASSSGALAGAADAAFEAGCVVIAPVGNLGAGEVRAPANARGALGIGAYDITSGEWYSQQSHGKTEDGRPKPDLIAATGVMTASARSDDALTKLSKTSGAAPVATGMAVLLRNYLRGKATRILPGRVYAGLIAAADTTSRSLEYDRAKHGAGRLALPDEYDAETGYLDLADDEIQEYTLETLGDIGVRRLRVAIWWPDPLSVDGAGYSKESHSDVNLEVMRVSAEGEETVVAESSRGAGTLERVEVRIPGDSKDEWVFRITGHDIPQASQRVYWAWIAEY